MIAYKYRSGRGTKDSEGKDVFERDIELLSRDTIYVPTVEQLNDPAEALVNDDVLKSQLKWMKPFLSYGTARGLEDVFRSLFDSIRLSGIYSLSKEIYNELMWAYYASGHSGYAIIFDTEVLFDSFERSKWGGMYEIDVKYSSKLPRFDMNIVYNQKETMTCLVGTKSKVWEHEKEHRLIFEKGQRCLKIDYRAIKGFVFGCRMQAADIDYVMKTFSGRDLEYYKVVLKDDSYKLSLTTLEDKYPTDEKYCPYCVEYNIEGLLEMDSIAGGAGYKYRFFVEEALCKVSREPFLTAINSITVSDEKKYPHIVIWTKVEQDGSVRRVRLFEYDVIDSKLVKSK